MEKQMRSSLQNLSISYEFALAIGNSLNLSEMLHEVIHKMVHKTNAHRGIIWVRNGEQELQPVASAGINIEDVQSQAKIMDYRNVFNQILKREQFVLRYKDDKDFLQYCPLLTKKEESVLIVPVTNVAILHLVYANREIADEPLANLLAGLSKKLSVAIEACTAHKNIINEVQVRKEAEEELKKKTEQLISGEKELQKLYGESEQARKSLLSILEDVERKEEAFRKSEEKYRLLADNSIDAIWQTDMKLVFTYVSPSIKNIFGYTVEEWVGTRLSQHASTKEFFNMARKALYAIKHYKEFKYLTFNVVMLHKDGTEIPVEITGKLLFNKKGLPIGLQGTTRDITEQKKAEEALKESEQRFRFMAENTGDVLYRLQHDTMTFEYLSPAISVLTGYTAEEINKSGFLSLVEQTIIPGAPDASFEELRKKRVEGKTGEWRAEYKILTKGGEEKWLGDHSYPWKDDSGKIIGSTGILQDITVRKRAELELAKHRDHLEDLIKERTDEVERSQKSLVLLMEDVNEVNLELKSVNTILDATNNELEAFSYSVSHDLRAPLTRMDGFSKALIDSYSSNLDDKAVHFLNRIRASSQHMAKLIDDLLSLSRITREKVTRQKVDLSQTAGKIANELRASEPGRQVNFEIAKGLSANADRKFVIIILENLLGNAFKFTGKKENAIIEFGNKTIDENEVFFIKDNGAGFNMKYYNKIFTAFQRLHSEEEYKGSGIGLAIVQRIINKHGGKIWAESEEGKGAAFYFRFE